MTRPPAAERRRARRRRLAWTIGAALAALVAIVVLFRVLAPDPPTELRLDEFRELVEDGEVRTATIGNRNSVVTGELADGERYRTAFPSEYGERMTQELLDAGVETETNSGERPGWQTFLLGPVPPTLLIVGVFVWFILQVQGGGKASRFARTKARTAQGEDRVTFADVAGADEAVDELRDVVEFLRDPERFSRLGARVPRGVLMVGPPGTGKTLLARAVAGEAGVPFFSISGSDFVEMFVGIGASRVRDLFRQAHDQSPAIVFIDEIDAVGRQRGAGLGGGHDEREQTLNQLLVQMDGFDDEEGVVLVAATNRADILDPALLRPGRFDRRIVVDAPDIKGRRAILDVHSRNKPLAGDVDLDVLARRTPGFTGADLANVLNEAALLAARRGAAQVHDLDVRDAIDRVLAGPERRSRVMSAAERRVVAVHEAGHAIVSHVLPGADEVHKISIVARGAALGHTVLLPEVDRSLHTRAELADRLAVTLGGRSAEEAVIGEVTTGATDDIERATRLAQAMVTELGMSDKLGPRRLAAGDGEPFLGRDATRDTARSDELAARIDEEVARLIDEAHERARRVIEENRGTLERLTEALLERETLADDDLAALLAPARTS